MFHAPYFAALYWAARFFNAAEEAPPDETGAIAGAGGASARGGPGAGIRYARRRLPHQIIGAGAIASAEAFGRPTVIAMPMADSAEDIANRAEAIAAYQRFLARLAIERDDLEMLLEL